MPLTTRRIDSPRTAPAESAARRPRWRRIRAAAAVTAVTTLLVAGGIAATLLVVVELPGAALPGEQPSGPLASGSVTDELDADDGFVERGGSISPFADDLPSIAKLDPALRAAMQSAARAAIADGVEFVVTSGWRSAAYQQRLFDDAVLEYGSVEVAAQFVLSPERSKHVSGEAVDIGRTDADSWLSQHGSDYGLCQIYANEMWHFELATEPGGECPPQLADGTAG